MVERESRYGRPKTAVIMDTRPITPPPSQIQLEFSQEIESNQGSDITSQDLSIESLDALKRLPAEDLVSQIPDPKSIKFNAINMNPLNPPSSAKGSLPPKVDLDSPISLFKLLLPDSLWHTVVRRRHPLNRR